MINYLSIDLESWASPNLPEYVRLSSSEKKRLDNGHIKKSALEILRILKKNKTKLTFFIVGQLYEWYPEVVEKIASEGHEIAYHTHAHDFLVNKKTLIGSIEKSKKFIQRYKPIGFRAPRIYLKTDHLSVLKKFNFKYDSSTYGSFYHSKKINDILELPVSTIGKIPIGSGYFIGALGKHIQWAYKEINKKDIPVISFIHNWQILRPTEPSFPSNQYLLSHPHYLPYLMNCASTFNYLLKQFRFIPMKNLIQ